MGERRAKEGVKAELDCKKTALRTDCKPKRGKKEGGAGLEGCKKREKKKGRKGRSRRTAIACRFRRPGKEAEQKKGQSIHGETKKNGGDLVKNYEKIRSGRGERRTEGREDQWKGHGECKKKSQP